MRWILTVLIQYKNLFLFTFLLIVGILFSSYRSNFHQNKINTLGITLSGGLYKIINNSKSYFELNRLNQNLLEENNKLQKKLLYYKQQEKLILNDSILESLIKYIVKPARVIKNSYSKARNIIILDKGTRDGIKKDMSVIGPKGIVGIINQTSYHYSSVISILHQDIKVNAKLMNSGAFGSLAWEGISPFRMKLLDVPVINPINKGDTIVTGGMSSYFPKGIPIGIIYEFENPAFGGYYTIEVELLNNLTDLEYVYIIENKDRTEVLSFQNQNKNATK